MSGECYRNSLHCPLNRWRNMRLCMSRSGTEALISQYQEMTKTSTRHDEKGFFFYPHHEGYSSASFMLFSVLTESCFPLEVLGEIMLIDARTCESSLL